MKKFGLDKALQEKYAQHHTDLDCDGVWEEISSEMPYRIEEGLILMIKDAPLVRCEKCGAVYFRDDFEERLLAHVAKTTVLTARHLHQSEIRFLRNYIGYTQEKLGQELGIAKTDISKYESLKSGRRMDDNLMVRFKLFVASKLGLTVSPDSNIWKVDHLATAKVISAQDVQRSVG
jgi:DNA-binding XRE family transcriptional regulator